MKSLSLSTPYIIAMVGIPGAGKTHFALQFSRTFLTPFINDRPFKKVASDPELGVALSLEVIKEIMKTKQVILYEGETDRRTDRDELVKMARKSGYKVVFVWVQTTLELSRQRTLRQMNDEQFEAALSRFSEPNDKEPFIVISGRHTYATQAKTLLSYLVQSRPTATLNTTSTTRRTPRSRR